MHYHLQRPGDAINLSSEVESLRAKILKQQNREDELSSKLSSVSDRIANVTRELHSLEV